MGARKRRITTYTGIPRQSYDFYGLDKRRVKELQSYCISGECPLETLLKACRGLEAISPWILLSVRQGKSFDTLAVRWELSEIEKPPFCRTDFYSCRRLFYHNLDVILREEEITLREIK